MNLSILIKKFRQKAQSILPTKDKSEWEELKGVIDRDKTSVEMEKEIWENID